MIALSELDLLRFGHVTAKVEIEASHDVGAILRECVAANVEVLIARCPTHLVRQVQDLERLGCFLTDTLVDWQKECVDASLDAVPAGFASRLASASDRAEVARIAAAAFHGYGGHYHADPRLDPRDCDEVYSSWAEALCTEPSAQGAMVLVTTQDTGQIAGFAALRRCADGEFDGTLFGVHPVHRGRGVFSALLRLAQQWGAEQSLHCMHYSTQLTNLVPQHTLCRSGFVPVGSRYTLHKWFD